jgi:hypothetical protein
MEKTMKKIKRNGINDINAGFAELEAMIKAKEPAPSVELKSELSYGPDQFAELGKQVNALSAKLELAVGAIDRANEKIADLIAAQVVIPEVVAFDWKTSTDSALMVDFAKSQGIGVDRRTSVENIRKLITEKQNEGA